MKPFNLEEAKAGKPVCTKDGRQARIICFDKKISHNEYTQFPIIALINQGEEEFICTYTKQGISAGNNKELTLMMASKKHEGWINIYDSQNSGKYFGMNVYETKEEAITADIDGDAVATVHIEWEE